MCSNPLILQNTWLSMNAFICLFPSLKNTSIINCDSNLRGPQIENWSPVKKFLQTGRAWFHGTSCGPEYMFTAACSTCIYKYPTTIFQSTDGCKYAIHPTPTPQEILSINTNLLVSSEYAQILWSCKHMTASECRFRDGLWWRKFSKHFLDLLY